MERFRYFDDYRDRAFACGCGWSGGHDELSADEWADVVEGSCPQCGTTLAVASYPTADEVRAAAATGNEEAVEMLEEEGDERLPFDPEFAGHHLERPGQLPDIAGETVRLTWERVQDEGRSYAEIRHHAHVLWRERAWFDDARRRADVTAILREKFGPRLTELGSTGR